MLLLNKNKKTSNNVVRPKQNFIEVMRKDPIEYQDTPLNTK